MTTRTAIRPLQSRVWKGNRRLQEAATTAFRSMKAGRDPGSEAVHLLQSALIALDGRSSQSFMLGDDDEPVREKFFGPYAWGDETGEGSVERCYFGRHTENAVRDFQAKRDLVVGEIDGIAGIATLHDMDGFLVAYIDRQEM